MIEILRVNEQKKKEVLAKQSLCFKLLRLLFIAKEFTNERLEIIDDYIVRSIVPFYAEDGERQFQILPCRSMKITYNEKLSVFKFKGKWKVWDCRTFDEALMHGEQETIEFKIYDYFEPSLKSFLDSQNIIYKIEKE